MNPKLFRRAAGILLLGLALGVEPTNESFSEDIVGEYVLSPRFPSTENMMLMYMDCGQVDYSDMKPLKTPEEVSQGVTKRRNLEAVLRQYFIQETRGMMLDTSKSLYDPLGGKGRFKNNFNDPRFIDGRHKEKHKGIDIFAKKGEPIYSPVNGVVVASSDDWEGHWDRRKGLVYEGGGLSRISGNGVIIFNPLDTLYYFMIHMNHVFAETGEIVEKGEIIGTVGRTGNASSPYSPTHLHTAVKDEGFSCGINGPLVPINPYRELVAARRAFDIENSQTDSR